MPESTPPEYRRLMGRIGFLLSGISASPAGWQSSFLVVAWNCACTLIRQDARADARHDIAGIMVPIAFQ
jgi:hypothetical protein